ncbi:esterase-like activity of phytase family protein [Ornithinimicrobium tianjinense]|uniref:Glycosyl transferase family 1 n=1 Tax=Ornithinimicrobium tianjinense TaxID=1195761 RepID=A0A917FAK0_9MICO|nr:esterase-like activity of phytase family protein [Ornithinimicrobium tianjinense]GGF57750.1 glycosyl transferase family 1 [Ornithinimicrobium tianjinense]
MQIARRSLTVTSAACVLALATSPAFAARPTPTGADADSTRSAYHLSGWAVLPAETFVPGSEESGAFTGNPAAPFPGQPVQGFSAVHAVGDGSYLVMSDNGFGARTNSQDFQLRVHHIRPDLVSGEVELLDGGFVLSDPDAHVGWSLWRADRVLTGWDFDIESMQIATDGTFWFGDEFGPYLLHTDAQGRLLEAPIPTPGVQAPQNAQLVGEPNLLGSKGFEGMAIAPNGQHLYPMLEGATAEDKAAGLAADLRIYDVRLHPATGAAFTGEFVRYRMESAAHALGDAIAINAHQLLIIERDSKQGAEASFKRVYLVDLRDRDRDGYVDKQLLVDLMDVPNPELLGTGTDPFTFPYFTIEDVEILDADTIAVLNDNNYPAAGGRGPGVQDVNEFLTIDLAEPLAVDHRLLPGMP